MSLRVDAHVAGAKLSVGQEMKVNSAIPSSVLELSMSCRNLSDKDVFSKTDPMCVLYIQKVHEKKWIEFGRTETILNNLNPTFVKKFVLEYFFAETQKLKFELYDVDCKSPNLKKHDYLGSMKCTLPELAQKTCITRPLELKEKKKGELTVSVEQLKACKEKVTLKFHGQKLDSKDFFGKSDPFLCFYRSNEDQIKTAVHRTEVVMNSLNPKWKPFTIPVRALCNGDYDRSLRVDCIDWNKSGKEDLIGTFSTTMRELYKGPCDKTVYELIHPELKAKKKYKNSGVISLLSCDVRMYPTFVDYVRSGWQVQCAIAVDFTKSNGDPSSPTSLHYMSASCENPYIIAIRSIMDIIQEYDSNKQFLALGFGASMPPDDKVSHNFLLNGDPIRPYCKGVEGVIDAYEHMLQIVQLDGPTNFAPCIEYVARQVKRQLDARKYFILLIITDGVITDMPQTTEAIVQASSLPLSIIIVGVGDGNFDAMNVLDGDDERLSSRGRFAVRDIVQFVPLRKFQEDTRAAPNELKARLAAEVLAEIPDQFLSYMNSKGFKPIPPGTSDEPHYAHSDNPHHTL